MRLDEESFVMQCRAVGMWESELNPNGGSCMRKKVLFLLLFSKPTFYPDIFKNSS